MILLKTLIQESKLKYPLAKADELTSFQGMDGWKGKVVWMSPKKFLDLAYPLPIRMIDAKSFGNLLDRMKEGKPLDFLALNVDSKKNKVIGHEGRHRALAAQELGIDSVPVLIYFTDSYPRVPKWSPEEHAYVDRAEFKPEAEIQEGVQLNFLNNKIKELEDEWERLDSQGTGHTRQIKIQRELQKLLWEKEKWEQLHAAVDGNYKLTDKNNLLESVPIMESKNAKHVEDFLRNTIRGTEWEGKVFAVGGFVRDELMGKTPKDIDVIVNKPNGGIDFTVWLSKKIGNYKEGSNPVIFPAYGTAKMVLDGVVYNGVDLAGEDLEAVMPRSEQYGDSNSRKPTAVQYSDLEGDARRRDLTINAIYKDISSGKLVDPVNGVDDIKNKIIRPPADPDLIYGDDALRMFRVIRFANRFGWKLTPEVVAGIKNNLSNLKNTSKERMRDELNSILTSETPDRGIQMLKDTGLLPYLSKELQAAVGMTQNKHHSKDVFGHTMDVLKKTRPDLVSRLMALFHDIGKVATRSETPTGIHFYGHEKVGADVAARIMKDLKYPNELIAAVTLGIRNHMRLKSGGDDSVKLSDKALRKFKIEVGDQLENILDVIHADNISHADESSMPNQIDNIKRRLDKLDIQVSKPNLPINGGDLKNMGIAPGPIYSKILNKITDEWYENPNLSKEDAINIAKKMI